MTSQDPRGPRIAFKAKLWIYEGKAAWHFVTLPKGESAKIKAVFGSMKRGWGSLPVLATMGQAQWKTSIFPDSKRGAYLLPIKAEVRLKEQAKAGDQRSIVIELRL
jgi:hypothetical protein